MSAGFIFFFFQAEDGIRATSVTGVQTCALPISRYGRERGLRVEHDDAAIAVAVRHVGLVRGHIEFNFGGPPEVLREIGRAACRERGELEGVESGWMTDMLAM